PGLDQMQQGTRPEARCVCEAPPPSAPPPKGTAMKLRSALLAGFCALSLLAAAAPAYASEAITTFSATTSTTDAGGHPDLSTSFRLDSPGVPEAAENVIFNAPTGIFGNPYAITHCTSLDFAQEQCPTNSQAGLITVYANYKGNSEFLL